MGYNTKSRGVVYKLEGFQEIAPGQELGMNLAAGNVELIYSDSTIEKGATWIATASAPLNGLQDASVQLRRSISF